MRCQDSDDVEYYLERFEKIMEDDEIPGEVYLDYLRSQFSGRHADCLRDAEADGCVDYAEIKSRLMRATGSTIREAEKQLFSQDKRAFSGTKMESRETVISENFGE